MWHCQIFVRITAKFVTAKLTYVALPTLALPNCWKWYRQVFVRSTAKFGTVKLPLVHGAAKLCTTKLLNVALPSFRSWHCQIWHCQTTVRGTAKFPFNVIIDFAVQAKWKWLLEFETWTPVRREGTSANCNISPPVIFTYSLAPTFPRIQKPSEAPDNSQQSRCFHSAVSLVIQYIFTAVLSRIILSPICNVWTPRLSLNTQNYSTALRWHRSVIYLIDETSETALKVDAEQLAAATNT